MMASRGAPRLRGFTACHEYARYAFIFFLMLFAHVVAHEALLGVACAVCQDALRSAGNIICDAIDER